MSRPRNPVERREVRVTLPLDLITRFELSQTSPTDGSRPQGMYAEFFTRALREHFDSQSLDVGQWIGLPPGSALVKASPTVIARLQSILQRKAQP